MESSTLYGVFFGYLRLQKKKIIKQKCEIYIYLALSRYKLHEFIYYHKYMCGIQRGGI